jgi:hypothetical protein
MATDQPHTIVRTETRPVPPADDGNYAICSCGYAMVGRGAKTHRAHMTVWEHATYMNKVGK